MNSFHKVSALAFNQSQPVTEPNKTNVIKPNFKAGNDSFVRQQATQNQQALQRQRQIEDFQKEQKKQKLKQNISWAAGIFTAVAFGAMLLLNWRSMRGSAEDRTLMKGIQDKIKNVKDPVIKQQIKAELAMNSYERNLTRAENLIKLDELAQDNSSRVKVELEALKEKLDKKIIGLDDAKQEFIENMSKIGYNIEHGITDGKPLVIVFDGAPGTCKTTLAKMAADSLGMHFKKIPCGGINDAQSIIGFRRTYVGSQAGAIAEAQIESGSKRVFYCLDEIDRVTKKEVVDALLAPFDDQAIFIDQYYGSKIDLSQSVFALTTNDFTRLPKALKERAKIVHIRDYTPGEKQAIAELALKNGLTENMAEQYVESINPEIYKRIQETTRDKGGRQTIKLVDEIINKIKYKQQTKEISKDKKVTIDNAFLDKIKLGKAMIEADALEAERATSAEWARQNL